MEEVGLFYAYVACSAILIKFVNLKYVFLILFFSAKRGLSRHQTNTYYHLLITNTY